MMMAMMIMMRTNCFYDMVDRRKAFSLICSRDHCHRSSPSRISDTSRAELEPVQNLSSDLVEWSCAVVITITPRHHKYVWNRSEIWNMKYEGWNFHKYEIGLEQSMKDSNFIFDLISRIHYLYNKIIINNDGSYIDFPKWSKSKKATANLKNNDANCHDSSIFF